MWQVRGSFAQINLLMWCVTVDKPAWPCQVLERNGDGWRVRLFGPENEKPIYFNARNNELLDYCTNMELAAASNPVDRCRLAQACAAAHAYVRQSGDKSQRAALDSPAFDSIVHRLQSSESHILNNQPAGSNADASRLASSSRALVEQARAHLRETTGALKSKQATLALRESALKSAQNELSLTKERLAQAELAVLGAKCAASAAQKKVDAKISEVNTIKDQVSLLDFKRRAALTGLRELGVGESTVDNGPNVLRHKQVSHELDRNDQLTESFYRNPNNAGGGNNYNGYPGTRENQNFGHHGYGGPSQFYSAPMQVELNQSAAKYQKESAKNGSLLNPRKPTPNKPQPPPRKLAHKKAQPPQKQTQKKAQPPQKQIQKKPRPTPKKETQKKAQTNAKKGTQKKAEPTSKKASKKKAPATAQKSAPKGTVKVESVFVETTAISKKCKKKRSS